MENNKENVVKLLEVMRRSKSKLADFEEARGNKELEMKLRYEAIDYWTVIKLLSDQNFFDRISAVYDVK